MTMNRRYSSKQSSRSGGRAAEPYVHSSSPSPVRSPQGSPKQETTVQYKLMSDRELSILDPILQAR
jgi:hypothetical protein